MNSIKSNDKGWLIIYSEWCKWSLWSLDLLKDKNPIMINLSRVQPSFKEILAKLQQMGVVPLTHRTRPFIFYNGEFIGGYNQLKEKI
jgi:glutaredoxin